MDEKISKMPQPVALMIDNTKNAIIEHRCPVAVLSAQRPIAAVTVHSTPTQIPDPSKQMPENDLTLIPTQVNPKKMDKMDKITSTTAKYFIGFHSLRSFGLAKMDVY